MPIEFKKKGGNAAPPLRMASAHEVAHSDMQPCVSGLAPSNRTTRTPMVLVLDGSPSLEAFVEAQLHSVETLVYDLQRLPTTGRSILMDLVQVGTPPSATGFVEIESFRVPPRHPTSNTPLHLALDRTTQDLGRLFADLRQHGIERTESLVIFATDGFANGCTQDVLDASIQAFLDLGKRWSVTNLVFGVGKQLNESVLKALANSVPPLRLEELKATVLMPFLERLVTRVSQSRRGQKLELELPDEIRPIE